VYSIIHLLRVGSLKINVKIVVVVTILCLSGTRLKSPTQPELTEWVACSRPLGVWACIWVVRALLACGLTYWGFLREHKAYVPFIFYAHIAKCFASVDNIVIPKKKLSLGYQVVQTLRVLWQLATQLLLVLVHTDILIQTLLRIQRKIHPYRILVFILGLSFPPRVVVGSSFCDINIA
jgi:hypothetical protein